MSGTEPTAIFLAMHKGGSSFLANDFADALTSAFPDLNVMNIGNQIDAGTHTYDDLKVPAVGAALVRVYPDEYDQLVELDPSRDARLRNTRLVVLQRDPRDASVSRYFSVAHSHTPPSEGAEQFEARRNDLVDIGPFGGILRTSRQTLLEFEHLYRIIDSRPDCLVTSYEQMVTDYRGWLHEIGTYLEWPLAAEEQIFDETQHSFELPIVGDPSKHIRRITPGNWRKYDRIKLRETFDERAGSLMWRAGYRWPR